MKPEKYRMEKLKALSDADLLEQTKQQYRAVVHLAKALALVHEENLQIMDLLGRGVVELRCSRSAEIMEMLGNILNGMDAVDEKEDAWLTPIFFKAQAIFKGNPT